MYRTCERYLSGALEKSSFVIQAARDQRTMLTVLAIEQLTRTARPPATVLGASGTSASLPNPDTAALIKQFADEKAQAQKAATAAQATYADALKVSDCKTITTAPDADPDLKNWAACNAAKADLDTKQAEAKAATDRLDKVLGVAGEVDRWLPPPPHRPVTPAAEAGHRPIWRSPRWRLPCVTLRLLRGSMSR
jgi:hypothetical protein